MTAIVLIHQVNAKTEKKLAFKTNEKLLQNRRQVRTDFERAVAEVRTEKERKFAEIKRTEEDKKQKFSLEEERKSATKRKEARQVAVTRNTSSKRSTYTKAQPALQATNGAKIMTATAYTDDPNENGGYSVTASGKKLTGNEGKFVATNDYPLGTKLLINDKEYVVEDRMARHGMIDILVSNKQEARNWGRRKVEVKIVK
ncbi:MAG: 3D/G5 protein [uncultured bacterium]|nr:MAG: 3D/G5 protein [uncultured bacterium]